MLPSNNAAALHAYQDEDRPAWSHRPLAWVSVNSSSASGRASWTWR